MTIDDRKGALGLRSRQDVVGTRDNRLFILAVRTVTLVYRDKTLQKTNSRNRYRLNQAELLKKNPNPKTILHLNHGSKLLCTVYESETADDEQRWSPAGPVLLTRPIGQAAVAGGASPNG